MSYSGSAGGGIGGVSPASTPLAAAVPGTKILLCKSGVKDKKPVPSDADYGELFVNYHSGSPMLCFKDNAGEIVEIKPTRQIDGGGGETPPSTGNEIGDTLWDGVHFRVWDGSTWVAIGPNDLAYVQKVDGGTITNSAGSDVDLPLATVTYAGLIVDAASDGKQYARANGAWAEVDIPPGTTVSEFAPGGPETGQLWYDTTNEQLKVYDGANWQVSKVDLGYTAAADKGTVTCSVGDDAELPLVSSIEAGLMSPGDKNKIDGYPATPGDLALNLQQVTDNGNTTTKLIEASGGVRVTGDRLVISTDSSQPLTSSLENSSVYTSDIRLVYASMNGQQGTATDDVYLYSNAAGNAIDTTGDIYGYHSLINTNTNKGTGDNYNFYAEGTAPNFLTGDTYIGGTVTRNTRELWESLLTEEQKEELTAGTLAIPANVSTPGDGSFVRQWWYNQQSAEDQALIDSGELEYPEHLQAANFVDTFALGDNTELDLKSNGVVLTKGIGFGKGGTSAGSIGHKGFYFGGSLGAPIFINYAENDGDDVIALRATFASSIDGVAKDAGDVAIFNANLGTAAGTVTDTSYDSLKGFSWSNVASGKQSKNSTIYGFWTDQAAGKADVQTYGFYAEGTAPNYFNGEVRCGGDSTDPLNNQESGFAGIINSNNGRKSVYIYNGSFGIGSNADPSNTVDLAVSNQTGIAMTSSRAQFSLNSTDNTSAAVSINRGGGALDDTTAATAIAFSRGGTQYGSIDISSTGAAFNNTSDYRAKTNIRDYTGASSVIQSLNVKQYTLFDKPDVVGFIAHELQEHVPDAVRGTKDATEAIGTLADYDGTVLETEVTEPSAEELTYTEAVTDSEGVATQLVRTRTWTATGTRPVYQGVDQSKLIPLLTKALQEALERIEVLEGLIAN